MLRIKDMNVINIKTRMFKSKILVIHHRKTLTACTAKFINMNSEILESCSPYFLDIIPILNVFPFGRKNLQVLGFFSVPDSYVHVS